MIDEKIYLICCYYYYNHIQKKEKIVDWCQFYSDLLYGNLRTGNHSKICLEPIFWKRFYNEHQKQAIELLEDNIQYCEIRHQIDVKKKQEEDASIKERR